MAAWIFDGIGFVFLFVAGAFTTAGVRFERRARALCVQAATWSASLRGYMETHPTPTPEQFESVVSGAVTVSALLQRADEKIVTARHAYRTSLRILPIAMVVFFGNLVWMFAR